jgi:hypothetical protein
MWPLCDVGHVTYSFKIMEGKPMTNPEIPAANSALLSWRLEARICSEN